MKERLSDLEDSGSKLFDAIQEINVKAEIENTVLVGDMGSLFPEYKIEKVLLNKKVDMAWLHLYMLAVGANVLMGVALFYALPYKEIAFWAVLVGFGFIIHQVYSRVLYINGEGALFNKVRRTAYTLLGTIIILTMATLVGALASTVLHVAALIFGASST